MRSHKVQITIPADHQLAIKLPDDFPAGPAEVTVLTATPANQRVVQLAGVLAPEMPQPLRGDPIDQTLGEFRREREQHFENLETMIEKKEDD
jgi:hypothetical protein